MDKKHFEEPIIELVNFSIQDVITASGIDGDVYDKDGDWWLPSYKVLGY